MAQLNRTQMLDIVNAGGAVLYKGKVITLAADVPTQEEIDAYALGAIPISNLGSEFAVTSTQLPDELHVDTGLKVHITNPGDIAGGGGGTGLTDTELRATPVAVGDGGGSLTVDGSVSVSNFPATQPVSGPLTDTQLRASAVPVSASTLPLPSGAATSANQSTGNTSLASIDGKLPTALGAGSGLKVDIVGNTAALGGISIGAPVVLQNNTTVTPSPEIASADISGRNYRGVRVRLQRLTGSAGTMTIRIYHKLPDGTYVQEFQTGSIASTSTGNIDLILHPDIAVEATTATFPCKFSSFVPDVFQIRIFASTAVTNDVYLDYQLLP